MDTKRMRGPGMLWLSAAMAAGGCTDPGGAQDLPPNAQLMASTEVVIDQVTAQSSGIEVAARRLISDAGVWAATWSEIHSTVRPEPALPNIDFAGSVVVVAAMGTKPTGGHTIEIEGVYRADDRLYVVVRETSPGSNCMTTQALTAPVVAVSVEKTGLPVSFVERRETVSC